MTNFINFRKKYSKNFGQAQFRKGIGPSGHNFRKLLDALSQLRTLEKGRSEFERKIEKKIDLKRDMNREKKREKERKGEKRSSGSIIINLHSIRKKKN